MRIGEIASGAEYWMDEQFQNLLTLEILIVFQIKKKILIPKISDLEN